jgi:Eukaryotic protein of unknown function (DUF866)
MKSLVAKETLHISCGAVDYVSISFCLLIIHRRRPIGLGRRESSAKFDPSPPQPYTDENRQFAPLLIIECRGLEFVGFDPQVK